MKRHINKTDAHMRVFERVGSRKSAPARFRPGLEHLENRWTPAIVPAPGGGIGPIFPIASVNLSADGHTLFITGTLVADDVVITQNDAANQLSVLCNGNLSTFAGAGITTIKASLKGGSDELAHNLVGDYFFSKKLKYKLGGGNDEVSMDFHGTGTVIGEYLRIKLDGGSGDDEVVAQFGRKQGGILNFKADMGEGEDDVFVNMWGDIHSGADVLFNLIGGDGSDTFTTWNIWDDNDGNSNVDIGSTSSFTIKMDGDADADSLEALFTGKVFGDLTLRLDGHDGNDTVGAVAELQDGSNGALDAKLDGGNDNDRMYLGIEEEAGSNVNLVNALLDGGAGLDDRYDASETTSNITKVGFEGTY